MCSRSTTASETVLLTDRQADRDEVLGQLRLQRLERGREVGALPVEQVDVRDARQPELLAALPQADRRDLDAEHARDDEQRALDDPQRAERLGLEARIAGRVDQVELAAVPGRGRERRGDRQSASALVVVVIRDGGAVGDAPEAADLARLVEQRLGQRRLPRPRWPTTATFRILSGANAIRNLPCVEGLPGRLLLPLLALERGALERALQPHLEAEDRLRVQLRDARLGDAEHLADLAQGELLVE